MIYRFNWNFGFYRGKTFSIGYAIFWGGVTVTIATVKGVGGWGYAALGLLPAIFLTLGWGRKTGSKSRVESPPPLTEKNPWQPFWSEEDWRAHTHLLAPFHLPAERFSPPPDLPPGMKCKSIGLIPMALGIIAFWPWIIGYNVLLWLFPIPDPDPFAPVYRTVEPDVPIEPPKKRRWRFWKR